MRTRNGTGNQETRGTRGREKKFFDREKKDGEQEGNSESYLGERSIIPAVKGYKKGEKRNR